MIRALKWLVFVVVLAAGVHWAAVTYAPNVIMWRVSAAMTTKGTNAIVHGERATAASRVVVKPSPDLLYSHCIYDVSRRPLRITTAAPAATYWSVSLYAANTDNFFALNDTAAKGQRTTIILIGPGQVIPPQPEGTFIVSAPTPRGLVLFRTLVNDDARESELDGERRTAKCQPL